MDGLLAEQSEFRFLEDKTILFSSICRFFTMTTVFIALKIDFIATKTVVILHDHGNPRQRRRSSWKSSAQLMAERPEKIGGVNGTRPDFVRKYSILRKLSFTTLSRFSSYSDKTGPISGWHAEHLRYSVTPKLERREKCQFKTNRNFNWNRKMAKKGLLSTFFFYIEGNWIEDSGQPHQKPYPLAKVNLSFFNIKSYNKSTKKEGYSYLSIIQQFVLFRVS